MMEKCFFLVVFLLCNLGCFQMGLGHANSLITWDDMKMDQQQQQQHSSAGLRFKVDYNGSRVIVVDMNGGADSLTVQGAIDMVPDYNTQRTKIYILPGIYREKVVVPRTKPFISLIGDESHVSNTIISWDNKALDRDCEGNELGTYRSASVTVESDYFCATGITFENTVKAEPGGIGMQAVALRVSSDRAFFYNVRILGTQDTLLDETGSHYFYKCHIQGSIDFIFGRANSLFQDCVLQSTAEKAGAIAAHHRDSPKDNTGFSFVNCVIKGTGKVLLGRAWGNYSRIIYSYCNMDDMINPSGWTDWDCPNRRKTVVFGEYKCSGQGADSRGRVPWLKPFKYEDARPYLDMGFIKGDQWLKL